MSENSIDVTEIINYTNEIAIDFDNFTESINGSIALHNSAKDTHPLVVQSISEAITNATDSKLALKVDVLDATLTKQGNTFNGANQLVQTNASGQLPALDASLLTNITNNSLQVNCKLPLKNTSGLVSLEFDDSLKLSDNKLSVVKDGIIKSDGSVDFSAEQKGVTPTNSAGLTTKSYVDTAVSGMIKSDGSVDFTSEQKGVTPTNSSGLATKSYVDSLTSVLATKTLSNITSAAATSLNSVGVKTVVLTYVNGMSWYRVWSDGWIEQGGFVNTVSGSTVVSLLKPFKDTNFGISVSAKYPSYSYTAAINSFTTSSITVGVNETGVDFYWQACGY